MGEAMKIDEYAPLSRPMNRGQPEVVERRRAEDPRTDDQDAEDGHYGHEGRVYDRASTWFIERLTTSV